MNDDVKFHANILYLPWLNIQLQIKLGDKYSYVAISNCFNNLYFKFRGLNVFFKSLYFYHISFNLL